MKKLVDRAQYMEEFLEFCQAPEQYHLARALKVDGPLGEFSRVLKKYDNRRDKQLVKRLMFANMVVQPEGDITRYVRDFGSVAGTDAEADFKAAELQAMSELLEKMGPDALTREKVSELRSDGNLVDGFKRAGDRARETVRRVKLMDTPAKNPPTASPSSRRSFPRCSTCWDPTSSRRCAATSLPSPTRWKS